MYPRDLEHRHVLKSTQRGGSAAPFSQHGQVPGGMAKEEQWAGELELGKSCGPRWAGVQWLCNDSGLRAMDPVSVPGALSIPER